ncbi:helix-turn-helix transcriptional regulator [Minwuia sp.]|uniref:helix-turn-helix transcriptional regulator n=1 Tax=Minwuia sp. TaxID=2493630 RepID=UPI003A904D3E
MLTHEGTWRAIDRLADRHRLSLTALARQSGLDATALNKSKRCGKDGKPRWLSTESLSKIMIATGTDLDEWVTLMQDRAPMPQRLPCMALGNLGLSSFDEAGRPAGRVWRQTRFPGDGDDKAFAIEIPDRSFEPVFAKGETIIVASAPRVSTGDRLLLCLRDGGILLREVAERTSTSLSVRPVTGNGDLQTIRRRDIRWLYRVRWSQY